MLSEKEFKRKIINNSDQWIDGDKEDKKLKTADLVNHNSKIAIEIKDQIKSEYKPKQTGKFFSNSYDIERINKRIRNQIENANRKFRNYENYKTALLLRTNIPIAATIKYAIRGLYSFVKSNVKNPDIPEGFIASKGLTCIGRREKHQRAEIGCFLVLNKFRYSYFRNKYAEKNRIIERGVLETIFDEKIKNLD